MPFRLQARHVFLTYSQANNIDSKESLLDHLVHLGPRPVERLVVGEEEHEDGGKHYHVYIKYKEKISITDNTYYDYCWVHPNIQPARRPREVESYVKKDGDFLTYGQGESGGHYEVCQATNSRIEWLEYCIQHRIAYQYAEAFWKEAHPEKRVSTITDETVINGEMRGALAQFNWNWSDRRSLVLVGGSGLGKTTWAKTNIPKPALFVSHPDRLKEFEIDFHKAIIFDDLSFDHIPMTAQIHLVDRENDRDIHIRYKTAFIPSNVFKVFTCNKYPFSTEGNEDQLQAIRRRIHVVNIHE